VGLRDLPCTEASSECTVKSSAAAFVRHRLLPHGHEFAVVAMLVGELSAQGDVGGGRGAAGALVGIRWRASAGAFGRHGWAGRRAVEGAVDCGLWVRQDQVSRLELK
jgi:hypothetical protein